MRYAYAQQQQEEGRRTTCSSAGTASSSACSRSAISPLGVENVKRSKVIKHYEMNIHTSIYKLYNTP